MHLTRDDILLSLDAQRAGHTDKEDVARACVGESATPHAEGSLGDAQRLLVRIDADELLRPLHKQRWITLEVLAGDALSVGQRPCAVGHCLLEDALVGQDEHLALYARA